MRRGGGSYYDHYGYRGSQEIVCIDCKEDGRDVPVILVESGSRCIHFRHKQGQAPEGLGRHGETAEHLHGKQLIMDWARGQREVIPASVEEEFWVTGARLRSDVKAELIGGRQLAFEVQRKPMESKEWDRRHGGYQNRGIRDVWFWSPDASHLVLDMPLSSVVLDVVNATIGIVVANYAGGYRHPTAAGYTLSPTHYAAAPLATWRISGASGVLVPPKEMAEYIGEKPESARVAQLNAYREAAARPLKPPRQLPQTPWQPLEIPSDYYGSSASALPCDEREKQRQKEAIARIFNRDH